MTDTCTCIDTVDALRSELEGIEVPPCAVHDAEVVDLEQYRHDPLARSLAALTSPALGGPSKNFPALAGFTDGDDDAA